MITEMTVVVKHKKERFFISEMQEALFELAEKLTPFVEGERLDTPFKSFEYNIEAPDHQVSCEIVQRPLNDKST